MMPGLVPSGHTAAHDTGTQLIRVAPQPIFYAGLIFLALVCLSYWLMVRWHLQHCQCPKPPKPFTRRRR